MNQIILKNMGKILEFDGNVIKIKQRVTKAEKSITINNIISVELKKPNLAGAGYIFFHVVGTDSHTKTIKELENDDNCFFISSGQYSDALKIKEAVERAKSTVSNNNQNISIADELLKWKQLQEQGVITEQEFEQKKKELLGEKENSQQQIPVPQRQEQSQREQTVKKNKGCLTAVIMILVIFSMGIYGISIAVKSSLNAKPETEVILDANEFSKISIENLIEKLGEPVRIENFVAPNGSAGFNYWYDIQDNHYDFYVVDDKVIELIASSENYWTGQGALYKYNKKNKSDIAECFGIKLSANAKTDDKNITYIAEAVSDTVDKINVQNIVAADKTYGLIRIIYDNSYFN